jgi:hypothetical protein
MQTEDVHVASAARSPAPVVSAAAASRIRPFERDDVPAVASLYEETIRSGSTTPPPQLADFFERTFFECPWADEEIPSLVYEDDTGRVAGFLGSHPRRLVLDGTPIRMACSGQLMTAPHVRSSAAGAMLLRRYLNGVQDLSITDGATDEVRRIWEALGGQSAALASLEWVRVLRPLSMASEYAARHTRYRRLAAACRPVARAIDAVSAWPAQSPLRASEPDAWGELLTPAMMAALLPLVGAGYRVRPDYDVAFLEWLFREMTRVTMRGTLIRTLVRDPSGRAIGWYVYYLLRGGISEVVQVAAIEREMDVVLEHLIHHAQLNGAAVLRGRLERSLREPLSRNRCVFRYTGMAVVHSRRPDVLAAVQLDHALLSRMEGEWWMSPHLEPFE